MNGARPLPLGSEAEAVFETGFLSGSAGAALMFLERYSRDHDCADLATARGLLDWVNDQAIADRGGLRWPLERDDPTSASGFELGVAGIAWVNLQAYRALGEAGVPRDGPPRRRLASQGRPRWARLGRAARHRGATRFTSASTAAPPASAGS